MSWRLWANLVLWTSGALHVVGQSSNVTECVSSYDWSINSRGQTPCLVAAYLESACGTPTAIDAIPPGNHYLGPTFALADPCRCSSVTYSLVSACGGCQDRSFANWTTWAQFCPQTEVAAFSRRISPAVEVPTWAYINVTITNNTFDPIAAQQVLNGFPLSASMSAPSQTPAPSPGTSSATSTDSSTSTSTPTLTATTAAQTAGEQSRSNAGAIAGGVVGGLVFLAIVGLLALWWFMRKRRNAVQRDFTFDSRALVAGPAMSQQTTGSPPDGPSPVPFSHSLYDADTNTYPGSPLTSAVFTHVPGSDVPGRRRSLESVSPSMIQLTTGTPSNGQPRGFTGAAEI